jgi:hypothetical protein
MTEKENNNQFDLLGKQVSNTPDATDFPLNKIIKRLEILKNYIVLEDIEDIKTESQKLVQYDFNSELKSIIQHIQNGEYAEAVNQIEQFISKNNQISIWTDPEISALKLEIKNLENQLVSFDNEKIELEGLLQEFNRKQFLTVGDKIIELLKLRKLKFKDDEEKFEEAEQDEKEYKEQFEFEKEKDVFELNDDEKKDLTSSYRKAAMLCHPDKFLHESPEVQEQAQNLMVELAIAKDKNDLNRVKEILDDLQKGILSATKGDEMTDKVKLKAMVQRLRNKITILEEEIIFIKESEEFQKVTSIEDWDNYFAELNETLSKEIEILKLEIDSK